MEKPADEGSRLFGREPALCKAGLANRGLPTANCWPNWAQRCTISSHVVSVLPRLACSFVFLLGKAAFPSLLFSRVRLPEIETRVDVTVGEA